LPNVSIAKVNANVTVSSASVAVTGIGNLTATPSVSTATEPVLLNNLNTNPLVVLDSNPALNPASSLILIGSGYVNTFSQQLQTQYNISMTPTTQLVNAYGTNRILIAGYYANQTTAAANQFIEQLYAAAGT
jgi:S-layer protein (TIGR01564 family)